MLEQEELVEDILLRIPPDDPASLLRAALVCRRWRHLVSAPAFRRRFLELHHAPPMLGLFAGNKFVPTSSFRMASRFAKWRNVVDVRHGRVLLRAGDNKCKVAFAVWDPIMRELKELPLLMIPRSVIRSHGRPNAALLCASSAAGSCSHIGCQIGPFLVVLVGFGFSYVYSSEAGTWTGPTFAAGNHHDCYLSSAPSVLLGNALYFMVYESEFNYRIGVCNAFLKYDLGTGEMCRVRLPPRRFSIISKRGTVLMAAKDGELGLAWVDRFVLYLWSMEAAGPADDGVGWTQRRTIKLDKLLPGDAISASIHVIGSVDGAGVIFLGTCVGIFTFDLSSSRVKKVTKARNYCRVIPYMSFYTPGLEVASTDEGPRAVGEKKTPKKTTSSQKPISNKKEGGKKKKEDNEHNESSKKLKK